MCVWFHVVKGAKQDDRPISISVAFQFQCYLLVAKFQFKKFSVLNSYKYMPYFSWMKNVIPMRVRFEICGANYLKRHTSQRHQQCWKYMLSEWIYRRAKWVECPTFVQCYQAIEFLKREIWKIAGMLHHKTRRWRK